MEKWHILFTSIYGSIYLKLAMKNSNFHMLKIINLKMFIIGINKTRIKKQL